MRSISRGPVPPVLESDRAAQQEAFVEDGKSSWRHADIVAGLRRDAKSKCMYCESFMEDVSYGAVEHIAPKSRFPERALDWDNLGYCCQRCNTSKGAYWSDEIDLRILDPYKDDLKQHFVFSGPALFARGGDSRGVVTLHKLKMKALVPLILGRMNQIEKLEMIVVSWMKELRPGHKELLAELIEEACGDDVEYTEALRQYAVSRGFPSPPGWS